ncbi:MAG: WD40/YVTN/BNR-like repeat-containing protein [Flavobacteriales bacterium]
MKKLALSFLMLGTAIVSNAQQAIPLKGKELFGDMKARHIGPALMSGRVSDIEGHPKNSKVIYIGTAGGGVWKSNDGGVMFNSIFDDYCQSIGCVAIDPNKPDNVVWVGTGETWTRNSVSVGDGIYKSNDGGNTWTKMGLEKSDRISSIQINPKNSDEIYVGVLGALWGDSEERGVYKTIDGGKTWEKIFYIDNKTGCSDLVMDPNDSKIMYASFWEYRRTAWSFNSGGLNSALYKTIDGGKTWNKIHNGYPAGKLGRIAVAIAPSNSQIVYSVIETEKPEKNGLYRSEDGGASWKHLNADFGLVVRPFYFSRIVVDPKNPDVLVKAGLFGSISKDGGKTFKGLGAMHPDIHDIWFDVNDSEKLFSATDGGLYRSLNQGTTMEQIENLPICQFYHIAVDNQEPYNIYGGLQDNGSWFGPSASPGGVEARDWEVIGVGDGFRVYPHPTDPNIMYSEMQGAENVWRYDAKKRQTRTIQPLPVEGDPKLRFNWNAAMTTSPNKPDRFYVGSQFVHRSDDKGDNWTKISPDLTTNDKTKQQQENSGGLSKDNSGAENHCTIFTIAESPLDAQIIWAGTDDGNVQVTQDDGKTWTNVTPNIKGLPANTWCYHIEASKFGKGTAYAVFDGHTKNDKNAYAFKTTDFGKTWKSIVTNDVYGFARSLQEDLENENLLFLGTEFGLYVTVDGGLNWSKFTNNMPATAVHYLEMHPKTNDLIMGTHGRGIIIIDDISPLRQIKPEMLDKDLVFMKTKPTVMFEESTFGGTSTETQFVGQNPNRDAKIIYYLAKRHTFGAMTMKVYDQANKEIATLAPGKQKGINIVTWNGAMKAPKIATGKTFSFGGMTPPRVKAGKYKVVIEKGKEKYETEVELLYTPNSVFTLEERDLQFKTTMELYKMTEDLAYLVYEIDEILKHTEANKDNKTIAKQATALAAKLNELKKTLVITSGDNYVGAAEPQLREKMGDIYSKVANYYGKPSESEFQNIKLIANKFNKAKADFESIKTKYYKPYVAAAEKQQLKPVELKTYDEFVKK